MMILAKHRCIVQMPNMSTPSVLPVGFGDSFLALYDSEIPALYGIRTYLFYLMINPLNKTFGN